MTVRAKFKVESYSTHLTSRQINPKGDWSDSNMRSEEIRTIVMTPVYSTVEGSENKMFWDASPSGKIELGTIHREAWEQFQLGCEYYVDFAKA